MENDPKVIALYIEIKALNKTKITTTSLIVILTQIIALVQKEVPEHGEYKKEIALAIVKLLIKDSAIENKEELMIIVDTMIDVLISVAKNKIAIFGTKNCCFN